MQESACDKSLIKGWRADTTSELVFHHLKVLNRFLKRLSVDARSYSI
jgi:hypothetical protein